MSAPRGILTSMSATTFRKHGLSPKKHALTASQSAVLALAVTDHAAVYGSPGSGKTAALKALFLSLLDRGLLAHEILALTATRDSANLLRDELALEHQGATAGPMAKTISSFAFAILRENALKTGTRAPELVNGSEQDRLLRELLETSTIAGWPEHIDQTVLGLSGFRAELRELFTVCLEHSVTPGKLRELSVSGNSAWLPAASLFEQYLNLLQSDEFENRFDPSTLLAKAAEVLARGDVPEFVRQIKVVLVDDAQELTPGAKHLLKVLVSSGAGLVLFGDPDTSTLGFRSADPQSMRLLVDEVAAKGEAKFLTLAGEHHVRTADITQAMANVTASLPTANAGPQRKSFGAANQEPGESVEGRVFDTATSESAWVARRLRELHLKNGIAWGDMAVVARSRNLLETFGAALATESVPTLVYGATSALRDEFASGHLLRLCKVALITDALDYEAINELIHSPFCNLDTLGFRRLRRQLRQADLIAEMNRPADELLVGLFENPDSASDIDTPEILEVTRFFRSIHSARALVRDQNKTAEDLLWHFWNESEAQKRWPIATKGIGEVAVQSGRNLDAVTALFAAANRYVERNPDGTINAFIEDQLTLDLPQDTLAPNSRDDQRVTLLTSAALIGRRFKVVVIPQLIEGIWPNLKPRSSLLGALQLDAVLTGKTGDDAPRSELPDEQRLLVKAVGAATERLIVTAVDGDESQISQFLPLVLGRVPETETYAATRYTLRGEVGRLRRVLVETTDEAKRLEAAYGLARLAKARIPGADPEQWFGILDLSTEEALVALEGEDAKQVYIAPSQLDDFLKCPLHWFMRHHGGRDSTFEASFGTLLHKVLEETAANDSDTLWQGVLSKWHTLEFEASWLEQKELRKAEAMVKRLSKYLIDQTNNGYELIGTEVDFEFDLGQAHVKGTVDRIERNADGKVIIVDLKTGAKPKQEKVDEHPQLGLYQLAFEAGAFSEITQPGDVLEGARLLFVGSSVPVMDQVAITDEETEYNSEFFKAIVAEAVRDMSMESKVFVAKVGTHCHADRYGACPVHLVPAVSYVE